MVTIKVLFFAYIREQVGQSEVELTVEEGQSLSGLKQQLLKQYPGIEQALDACRFAINQEYTTQWERTLNNFDEVALIPPVSGG